MGRHKKWINKKKVSFNMEEDLYNELKQGMLGDGYESLTKYLNNMIKEKLMGNNNDLEFLKSLFESGKVTINKDKITEDEVEILNEI